MAVTSAENLLCGRLDDIEWEQVACLICGRQDSLPAGKVESHGAEFCYQLCTGCGLKYMNPRPTRRWYDAHYANEFWEYKGANRSWRDKDKKWRWRDIWKRNQAGRKRHQTKRLTQIIPALEAYTMLTSASRMLDIGCAFGVIGRGIADHFGCEAYGVEPNSEARSVAAKVNGIKILTNQAEQLVTLTSHDHFFDLVLMSNVLENILDPVPILSACRRLLTVDGVICIHMPNFYYYDAMNPYHPYIYSPETLTRLCSTAALEVKTTLCKPPVSAMERKDYTFGKADLFMTVFAVIGRQTTFPDIVGPQHLLDDQVASLAAYSDQQR